MANPLQKFKQKPSAWRFVKLALKLRAPEPAFGYVLITLAGYANAEGVCYPGYGTLMQDTAYTSKQTITGALKYWRGLGVLTWKKGWGNTHKSRPNVYQFHEEAMHALYAKQKAERGNLSEPIDESSVRADESSVGEVRNLSEPDMKAHSAVAKVLALEGPSKQNVQAGNSGVALFPDVDRGRQESVQHSPMRESSTNEISSESSPNGISSSAHAEPPLADLKAKFEHHRTHGGCSEAELRFLQKKIEFLTPQGEQ